MGTTAKAVTAALLAGLVLAGCETAPPAPTPTTASQPAQRTPDTERAPDTERGADAQAPPAQLPDPATPRAVAVTLARAERALADQATSDKHRSAWAQVQQQAYRKLAAHPRQRDIARKHIPGRFRAAYDLTLRAAVELRQLNAPRQEAPADWRIRRPLPVGKLRGYYREAQAEFGVPWRILAAINFVETRFGRIHGDSHAGAQGPMQFMPPTWDSYGRGDVNDPRDAILAAGRYLAASGAPADMRGALFAYNRSDHYVEAILAYADAMRRYPHYLDVYHRWQVYFRTPDGDVLLEEGYGS